MSVDKEQGFILIESMVLLCVVTLLIVLYCKVMISASSKNNMYKIKEDILTMEEDDYEVIDKLQLQVLENNNIYTIVTTYEENEQLSYLFRPFEEDKPYIRVDNGKMFLISDYDKKNDNKIFRMLKVKIIDAENKKIIIMPSTFIIKARSIDEIGFNF